MDFFHLLTALMACFESVCYFDITQLNGQIEIAIDKFQLQKLLDFWQRLKVDLIHFCAAAVVTSLDSIPP
jgi:hypothetical protein